MACTRLRSRLSAGKGLKSFTLVELLLAMGIVLILVGLLIGASKGVFNRAKRSRAQGEVQAMTTALEAYKVDNGIYPPATGLTTNTYPNSDGSSSGGLYQVSANLLFTNLTGQTYLGSAVASGAKSYISFKVNQLGNPTTSGSVYIADPWGFAYGYSTGTSSSYPFNGTGFFDLWSTAGLLSTSVNTNAWISNWQ